MGSTPCSDIEEPAISFFFGGFRPLVVVGFLAAPLGFGLLVPLALAEALAVLRLGVALGRAGEVVVVMVRVAFPLLFLVYVDGTTVFPPGAAGVLGVGNRVTLSVCPSLWKTEVDCPPDGAFDWTAGESSARY